MDLFTYLLGKNGKNSLVHKGDLFSYLLGKNNSIPLKTAEGVFITIEALKTKINELKMMKESSQETTEGYNVFPYALAETKTQNGITITSDGKGNYTINGTATSNVNISFDLIEEVILPVSVGNNGNGKMYLFNNFVNSNSTVTFIYNNSQIDYWTFNTVNRVNNNYGQMGGEQCNKIAFTFTSGQTITNGKVSPMFTNDGDTTHDFEPFTGNQSSPSPDYPQEVKTVKGYRNLFDGQYYQTYTGGSVPYTYSSSNSARSGIIKVEPNTTYTITKELSNRFRISQFTDYPVLGDNAIKYNYPQNENAVTNYTLTTENTTQYLVVQVTNESQENVKMQVVEGTEELPYVPYGNNYIYDRICGKNLFDKLIADVVVGYIDSSGNVVLGGTSSVTRGYIPIIPNTDLILSGMPFTVYSFYDKNRNFIERVIQGTNNFTFNKNAYYMRFQGYTSTFDVNTIQLEQGTTATTYEAYKETIVPIPLNNNEIAGIGDYKDELIVDGNGHCWLNKKTSKVILDGSETSWNYNSVSQGSLFRVNSPAESIAGILPMSNRFIGVQYSSLRENGKFYYNSSVVGFDFIYNTYTNVEDFKIWLSTHNTTVYYVLATPQLIDLNYTVDIRLFKGVNNISNSDDMDMTLKYY